MTIAAEFEAQRPHLRSVAYRMLGSSGEVDDALQEAWLKVERADTTEVHNVAGWLTTMVGRVCLDMLRSRKSRREDAIESEPALPATAKTPESDVALVDAIGPALLVVLDTLDPGERVAFVLHDMFSVPFDEIAPIVGKSEAATRQLASRGRRRVQGADPNARAGLDADIERKHALVAAFLAASRDGNFEALLAMLDPEVVMRTDEAGQKLGAPAEARGADAVAKLFVGRAAAAQPALVDGAVGAAASLRGVFRFALELEFAGDKIVGLVAHANPSDVAAMEIEPLTR